MAAVEEANAVCQHHCPTPWRWRRPSDSGALASIHGHLQGAKKAGRMYNAVRATLPETHMEELCTAHRTQEHEVDAELAGVLESIG